MPSLFFLGESYNIKEVMSTPDKTVIIVVYRGCVSEVKNLPPGYDYEIQDLDVLDEDINPDEE